MRRSLIVGSRLAYREQRLQAALASSSGLQIMTFEQAACRLAGGFLEPIRHEDLLFWVSQALAHGEFKEIGKISSLPGMVRAVAGTLTKAWQADLDLQSRASEHPRLSDLAAIESFILKKLAASMKTPRELARLARERIQHAPAALGSITVRNVYVVPKCWREWILELSKATPMEWHALSTMRDELKWLEQSPIQVNWAEAFNPHPGILSCANPKHEVIEAFRWARKLIASGEAEPGQIAIASASTEEWDDHVQTLAEDSQLPIHIVHGRKALSSFAGQQCAALAEVLFHGLSHERVKRVIQLCRSASTALEKLPDTWLRVLPDDAPLLKRAHWEVMFNEAAAKGWPEGVDQRPILMPILELLEKGFDAAAEAGEKLLDGQSLALWKRAMIEGPAEALPTTLGELRVDDGVEPASSVLWCSARALATAPRRFVRLLGMTSRSWPRSASEDALLSNHILPSHLLQEWSVPELDRLHFQLIKATTATELVLSRSRRSSDGRLLGVSPLLGQERGTSDLRRSRIPEHAFSEADRLLACPEEFKKTPLCLSVEQCWHDWDSEKITPHDGLLRAGHPVIERILKDQYSATRLRKLLRDPIAFVWTYALRMSETRLPEEPLALEAMTFGNLVHEVLEKTVRRLERRPGGLASSSAEDVLTAIDSALAEIAPQWEQNEPIPPRLIWLRTLEEAKRAALRALTVQETTLAGQQSWAEIPFGDAKAEAVGAEYPWNPGTEVLIADLGIRIKGKVDRIDLDSTKTKARLTDYKTGKLPDEIEKIAIDGGKELQRCIYSLALRSLLPDVTSLESRLLYTGEDGGIFPLPNPEKNLADIMQYIRIAMETMRQGLALPGKGSEDEYNDLLFALPANAVNGYLERKSTHRDELLKDLKPLWDAP
jgi:ribosomal protein L7Ae-like RNA K-turn-binding protein